MQKATPVEEPKDKPKVKKAKASKYEELPEIPDYERPVLEKYDKSDFDPSKKVMQSTCTILRIVAHTQILQKHLKCNL